MVKQVGNLLRKLPVATCTLTLALGSCSVPAQAEQATRAGGATDRLRYEIATSYDPRDHRISANLKLFIPKDFPELQNKALALWVPVNTHVSRKARVNGFEAVAKPYQGYGKNPADGAYGIRIPVSNLAKQATRDKLCLEISYSSKVEPGQNPSRPRETDHFVILSKWHPELERVISTQEPNRFADFHTHWRLPAGYQLISSGVEPEQQAGSSHETAEQEITSSQRGVTKFTALLTKKKYERLSREHNGTRINYWYWKETTTPATAHLLFSHAVKSLELYSRIFGPYPYRELDLFAEENSPFGGAVAYPGLVLLGNSDKQLVIWGGAQPASHAIAHEVAHQWWGIATHAKPWRDTGPLIEGLANFSAHLYAYLHLHGATEPTDSEAKRLSDLDKQIMKHVQVIPNPETNSFRIYHRPSFMLHALATKLGSLEHVVDILQAYFEANCYRSVEKADFLQQAEQTSGVDLKEFFQDWLPQR